MVVAKRSITWATNVRIRRPDDATHRSSAELAARMIATAKDIEEAEADVQR